MMTVSGLSCSFSETFERNMFIPTNEQTPSKQLQCNNANKNKTGQKSKKTKQTNKQTHYNKNSSNTKPKLILFKNYENVQTPLFQ